MAIRATGSATISFGLVAVPVKLYTATEAKVGVSFNLMHACGARLKQQYVCSRDSEVVERGAAAKGYEYEKDKYVIFSAEEIKSLEEQATHAIDIAEFLPADAVDPLHYDKPYFLGPDKGAAKAYCLLAEAMRVTDRVAIARYAARGKSYLVLLRPFAQGMVMHQLLYADEVRSIKDVPLDNLPVKDQELKMAKMLIGQLAAETFSPEKYEDEAKKRMLDAIQQKIDGGVVSITAGSPKPKAGDLMAALQASLKVA